MYGLSNQKRENQKRKEKNKQANQTSKSQKPLWSWQQEKVLHEKVLVLKMLFWKYQMKLITCGSNGGLFFRATWGLGENNCINSLHYEAENGNGKDFTDGLPESSAFYETKSIVNLLSLWQSVTKEYILNMKFLLIFKCFQVKLVTVDVCFAN